MADISRVRRKNGRIYYAGKSFLGFNKPRRSDRRNKKIMVLARSGRRVQLIHAGQRGYRHNYSPAAKSNYLRRSAGIRNRSGKLTAGDRFSANHWARKILWNRRQKTTSEKRALRRGLSLTFLFRSPTPHS